jgi:pSer/pThr/pTyr-binding forkhead associated (FHA) protein
MDVLGGTRIRREATPATVNLRRCKLIITKGAQRGSEFVVGGDVVRIGKATDNDLVISDETVSRNHFEIVRDGKGYLVRDLQSTNGTFLDGAEIKEAYLRAGSVVGAGAVELKFTPFEERIEILPSEREQLGEMVGRSTAMREIFGLIERIAPTDATVLIEGETGTGKDMVARTLHLLSRRKDAPFVVVDCGAVAGTLIESELFGHEKGAFTGAVSARQGAFELASGGTVFLDELGELSLDLQPKLLRVLEQRELRRVGGAKTQKVDLRVIAATRKDLRSEVEKGKFREDLYFRLNVVPITAPALRDRKEDVPRSSITSWPACRPPACRRRPHRRHPGRALRPRLAGQRPRAAQRPRAGAGARQRSGRAGRAPRRRAVRARWSAAEPMEFVSPACRSATPRSGGPRLRAPLPDLAPSPRRRQHLQGGARRRHGPEVLA